MVHKPQPHRLSAPHGPAAVRGLHVMESHNVQLPEQENSRGSLWPQLDHPPATQACVMADMDHNI